tara:strand:- start:463 stop:1758 length:1296 start_codon:yes stop_codon:yes gene_type:complete
MALDFASFQAALKEHYKPLVVKNLVYKNNPLLALIDKYEKFGGEGMPIPVINGNPQNRSATFAQAQNPTSITGANSLAYQSSKIQQFFISRITDYSIAQISGQMIDASASNADAFMRASTTEIDGALHSCARSLAVAMYRDGTGTIGQVAAAAPLGNPTIALANAENITHFEVGMALTSSATAAGVVHSGGGLENTAVVLEVNRDAGTIRVGNALGVATNWNGLFNGAAGGDFIQVLGDAQNGAAAGLKVSGVDAWVPSATPGTGAIPANLFGVNRTTDPTRLGGVRFNGAAMPLEEALIGGASLIGREGGRPDHCFMSFSNFSDLVKSLGSKVIYVDVEGPAGVGFRALELHAPYGTMKVIPDLNCPDDAAYLLQLDTWSLNSIGGAPKILMQDGNRMLRMAAADAVEVRIGYYANVACNAPGWNCRVAL